MQKTLLLATFASASMLVAGCNTYGYGANDAYYADAGPWGYYDRSYYDRFGRYDWNSPDPSYNGYWADRYYRTDRRYRERVLTPEDRIYRGNDGRYYCRRNDGTTGLIVGGIAGGILGNIIAPGDSKTIGTVIGALSGAAVGTAIDTRSGVRCR